MGGVASENAAASMDSFRKQVNFLNMSLKNNSEN